MIRTMICLLTQNLKIICFIFYTQQPLSKPLVLCLFRATQGWKIWQLDNGITHPTHSTLPHPTTAYVLIIPSLSWTNTFILTVTPASQSSYFTRPTCQWAVRGTGCTCWKSQENRGKQADKTTLVTWSCFEVEEHISYIHNDTTVRHQVNPAHVLTKLCRRQSLS